MLLLDRPSRTHRPVIALVGRRCDVPALRDPDTGSARRPPPPPPPLYSLSVSEPLSTVGDTDSDSDNAESASGEKTESPAVVDAEKEDE